MTWRYLPYRFTLRAPMLLTTPSGDPNSAGSRSYVRGAEVRGAVARQLGDDTATVRALVLNEQVRYLNAYPVVDGRRTVPAPVSLRTLKYPAGDRTGRDLAAYPGLPRPRSAADGSWIAALDDHNVWPAEQLRGRPDFLDLAAETPAGVTVARSGRLHNQRDRRRGRAWTDKTGPETEIPYGTMFGYESVDAGQQFAGLLMVREGEQAERLVDRLREALDGQVVLFGRSRRAGYGGNATFHLDGEHPRDRELDGPQLLGADVPAGTPFRMLLTAPYLGRHPLTGQPDPAWFPEEARQALEAGTAGDDGTVEIVRAGWSLTAVGGYNRTWGLPLPQRPAVDAGAVLCLRAHADLPLSGLLAVEHEGLGERRIEGFGRVAFLTDPDPAPPLPVRSASTDVEDGDVQPTVLARTIERRIAEEAVGRWLEATADRRGLQAQTPPSPALLGRFRTPLRGGVEGLRELHRWVAGAEHERLRPLARKQLERCRLTASILSKGQQKQRPVSLRAWLGEMTASGPGGGHHKELGDGLRKELNGELERIAKATRLLDPKELHAWLLAQEATYRVRLVDLTLAALQEHVKRETSRRPHAG